MHEDLFKRGWWRDSQFLRPARWYTASSCLGAPAVMPGNTGRTARSSHRGMRQQVPRSVGRHGKKCPLSAPQCQPGPLAAGIQYSIEERLCFPSACVVRLVLQPHTARQSLSQDISLLPRPTITSLFLPVLKHTVLASACNLKCQVPSLWHHKGVSFP